MTAEPTDNAVSRTPTPYERLRDERRTRPPRPRKLSDYQREQRKVANTLSSRRANKVLMDRHRDEYNEILRVERHALVAMIDRAYAALTDPVASGS